MKNDFEIAFEEISSTLLSYLYRLTTNRQDAEDLLQDTYLRIREKINTFRGESSFKTWAFTVATNLARDHSRVKKRWRLDVQDECKQASLTNPDYHTRILNAFASQPEHTFELVEHINYCFTCISRNLTLEKQIAIILKEFYDFKRQEIASLLGLSEGVVKHLLYDGRRELQKKYDHRCAMINKSGVCYQCAELNDFLQVEPDAVEKVRNTGLEPEKSRDENLDIRFQLIRHINPLNSKGAHLEDVILQILREVTDG